MSGKEAVWAIAVAPMLFALAGCGSPTREAADGRSGQKAKPEGFADPTPEEREESHPNARRKAARDEPMPAATIAMASAFAAAIVEDDAHKAYGLLSRSLAKELPFEDFRRRVADAEAKHGKPLKVSALGKPQFHDLEGDRTARRLGFSPDIPDDDRLAWLNATFALELDGDEVLSCYNCWMLMENDHGEARVGHFEFVNCD